MEPTCQRFPILTSYCCDIPERKEISEIGHETSVRRQYIGRMGTMIDFQATRREQDWSIQNTLKGRKCFSGSCQEGSSCHDEGVRIHTSERKECE